MCPGNANGPGPQGLQFPFRESSIEMIDSFSDESLLHLRAIRTTCDPERRCGAYPRRLSIALTSRETGPRDTDPTALPYRSRTRRIGCALLSSLLLRRTAPIASMTNASTHANPAASTDQTDPGLVSALVAPRSSQAAFTFRFPDLMKH